MPATVFPAPGASSGIQWNTYTSTTTASSSGSTVTITGTTDSRWVGTTPAVVSGTGKFANNTVISSAAYINTYTVSFNGTNQYLLAPSTGTNAAFTFAGNFTVEGWFYPTTITGSDHAIFCLGTETTNRYVWYISNGGGITSNLYGFGSRTYAVSTPVNTWTHIAIVRSGSTVSVYVNGVVSSTTDTQAGTIGNGSIKIGSDSSGVANFAGYISNFRIVSGVAVYSNTFTLPTTALAATQSANANGNPSSAITGTQTSILTCQSSTIIDNGTANAGVGFTISNPNTSTTIVGTVPGNTFTVNIAPTVALSSASITISESAINGITDSNRNIGKLMAAEVVKTVPYNTISSKIRATEVIKTPAQISANYNLVKKFEIVRGSASPNTILLNNINKLKVPYTNTEVFYTLAPNNLQKQIEVVRGGASPNTILTGKAQDSFVVRGSSSPNTVLSANLQKQLEIIKNPTPTDAIIWDTNNITKLKIPYTNAEVFYTISSSNLQKQIEVVRGGASSNNILTSNLQKQIEVVRGGASRNIILTGKAQDNYVARGSASPNTILLNNINKLKVPYTNTEVFYTISSSNMQKQFEIVRGSASSNNILTSNLQKQIEIVRGGASSNNILTSNLQKQLEIIKNPTPTDAIIWDTNNITKLKVPYTSTEVFYAASLFGKAQDNYVARGSASPNTILTGKAQDNYVARGSASPNTILLNNINKLKVPYTNTEVFYAASLFGKAQDNYVARGSASPNTVSLSNINSTILQSTVFTTTSTGIPRENLYYAQIAQGRYGSRFPYFYPAAMPNNLSPSNLQKQIEVVRGGASRNIILTGKAQDNYVARGSASPNTVSLNNINGTILQSSVTSITSSGIPRENLYYAQIAQGRYGSRFPYFYPGAMANNITVSNLQKQLEVIKNPTPNEANIWDVYNITKLKVPFTNTEIFSSPSISNLQKKIEVVHGGASPNLLLTTNLQKQLEVIKNPAPNEANIWDVYNITKLKVPFTNTEIFSSPSISNLQKKIEVIKNPVPNEANIWDISIIRDGYRAKGTSNISYLSLINRVEKQKINTSTTEVFFGPNYGSVIKFKTGATPGTGITDPSFNRISIAVPIQFWN